MRLAAHPPGRRPRGWGQPGRSTDTPTGPRAPFTTIERGSPDAPIFATSVKVIAAGVKTSS